MIKPETWLNRPDYCEYNNGWGICNTGFAKQHNIKELIICSMGGVGCNVDHAFVKARNLEKIIGSIKENS